MTTENDEFWMLLAQRVRGREEKDVQPDEADAFLWELPPDEVSSSEEDDIVAAVLDGVTLRERRDRIGSTLQDDPASQQEGPQSNVESNVEEDVLQMNRNKGRDVNDEEAERLAEQLRREALEEDGQSEPDEDEGEPRDG